MYWPSHTLLENHGYLSQVPRWVIRIVFQQILLWFVYNPKWHLPRDVLRRYAYNNYEKDLGILDVEIAQLVNSDTEDEEFNGFMED